jgi:hypothetical protein
LNERGNGGSTVPPAKKKTASKTSKAGASAAKKASVAKSDRGSRPKSAVKKSAVSKKSASVTKVGSKKASAKFKPAIAHKKVSVKRPDHTSPVTKAVAGKKPPGSNSPAKNPVQKNLSNREPEIAQPGNQVANVKSVKTKPKPPDFKQEPAANLVKPGITEDSKPVASRAVTKKKKSSESGSVSQAQAKQAPKKRGWRDIEALTERARLKNLLSDIWHEDIDLDSDIFGETDQYSSYYTDKEEEIEVEEDKDEEWEEFEEDGS